MGASHGGTSHNKSSNALKTIEEIRKGNIRDLYVLTGENDFLKERVVSGYANKLRLKLCVWTQKHGRSAFFDQLFSVFSHARHCGGTSSKESHSRCHDKCCFIWELKCVVVVMGMQKFPVQK